MTVKTINALCFLLPFVSQVFNLQNVVRVVYASRPMVEVIAYGSLCLLFLGIIINVKNSKGFSKTARLWLVFFIFYYAFAILASVIHDNPANILASIIPVIYVLAFYVYLSDSDNRMLFGKVALISLIASSILSIYLYKLNWSVETNGIHIYSLGRAGGVYGDANETALVSIIAFIFVYRDYNPTKTILKFLKVILLLIIIYNLIITYSTTGFVAFVISFILLNYKYFKPKRMLFVIVLTLLFYFVILNLKDLTSGLDLSTPQRDKINNIVNILTFNTSEVDSSGRDRLLANLLKYVFENPIIGNGVGFTFLVKGHNTFFGVWADAGIFTFLVFMIMLGNYFKNTFKSLPDVRYFVLPILIVLCLFMISLQSVITKGYIMALFIYIAYLLDGEKSVEEMKLNTGDIFYK